jgi:spermidine/putrescine-binding protein
VAIVLAAACCGSRARAAERDDAIQVLIVSGDTDPAVAKARLAAWSAKHAAAAASRAMARDVVPGGFPCSRGHLE